jgi:3-dehydro-4-phosphotetronate decarboxylase
VSARADRERDLRGDLAAAGRAMLAERLTWGSAGNVSARLDDDWLLISASGAELGALGDDDLLRWPLEDGGTPTGRAATPETATAGAATLDTATPDTATLDTATPDTATAGAATPVTSARPSKELPMHRAAYRARTDVGAVLHGASFYATLVACSDLEVPAATFVESMYYLERVARVPYRHPGSEELGALVGSAVRHADVLLLEHHGVLVVGPSLAEAMQAMRVLEIGCTMAVVARAAALRLRTLADEAVRAFRDEAAYKPRKRWPA